jgi:hypothetical protein
MVFQAFLSAFKDNNKFQSSSCCEGVYFTKEAEEKVK